MLTNIQCWHAFWHETIYNDHLQRPVLYLSYEELCRNTLGEMKRLLSFMGYVIPDSLTLDDIPADLRCIHEDDLQRGTSTKLCNQVHDSLDACYRLKEFCKEDIINKELLRDPIKNEVAGRSSQKAKRKKRKRKRARIYQGSRFLPQGED